MDPVTRALELAERVVLLRAQLAEAEGELRRAVTGRATTVPRALPSVKRAVPAGPPVSQRVRDLLHDGNRALTFGELVDLVGGTGARQAARAALKKLRSRKQVAFRGGKYSWVKQ